ncbi:hypothetical protein ScPMuIL_011511 [Solemya velum]
MLVHYALVLAVSVLSAVRGRILFRTGRHICVQEKQVAVPIPSRQTYWRPFYKKHVRRCSGDRLCTDYRLTYGMAVKTVYHMQLRTKYVHTCCPGWGQSSPRDKTCMTPLCGSGCENGGSCTNPSVCACPPGFTGTRCENDIDECASTNKCQQECVNNVGSYECVCQTGFTQADDGVTCEFCLTCFPEFAFMQESIEVLQQRVQHLEKEKNSMKDNMTILSNDYERAMSYVDELKQNKEIYFTKPVPRTSRRSTTPPPTPPPTLPSTPPTISALDSEQNEQPELSYVHEMLASLSEQISMLEEQMVVCTCKDYN